MLPYLKEIYSLSGISDLLTAKKYLFGLSHFGSADLSSRAKQQSSDAASVEVVLQLLNLLPASTEDSAKTSVRRTKR